LQSITGSFQLRLWQITPHSQCRWFCPDTSCSSLQLHVSIRSLQVTVTQPDSLRAGTCARPATAWHRLRNAWFFTVKIGSGDWVYMF